MVQLKLGETQLNSTLRLNNHHIASPISSSGFYSSDQSHHCLTLLPGFVPLLLSTTVSYDLIQTSSLDKMLGEFITRILLMILGYAYPALQCYKTIEKRNHVDNAQLRFWCEYWIIIAMLTVLERFGDLFISWLPMYSEAKLAFVIYLWYPKTKGTSYVYQTLLRPFVSEHETDIDQKLHNLRARVWDLAIFYWQNCTEVGQSKLFDVLGHVFTQPSNVTNKKNGLIEVAGDSRKQRPKPSARPLPPPNTFATFFSRSHRRQQSFAKTWSAPLSEGITVY